MSDIENIQEIVEANGENINPFDMIGVEPWVYRSLGKEDIKEYLKGAKKLMARFHHEDKFRPGSPEQKLHTEYFKIASGAIDHLLSSNYFFEKSLAELQSGHIFSKQKNQIRTLNNRQDDLAKKVKDLEKENQLLKASKGPGILGIIGKLRHHDQAIHNLDGTYAYGPHVNACVKYISLHDGNNETLSQLKAMFSGIQDLDVIQKQGEDIVAEVVERKYYEDVQEKRLANKIRLAVSHGIQDGVGPTLKGEYLTPEELALQTKIYPTFRGKIRGAELVANTSSQRGDMKILGTVTYPALKAHMNLHKIDPKLILRKANDEPEISALERHYSFETKRREGAPAQVEELLSFTSPLIRLNTPLLVREHVKSTRRHDQYQLIIPVAFEEYKPSMTRYRAQKMSGRRKRAGRSRY